MARLYGCCGVAAAVFSSEPWISHLSTIFGIATGLFAISVVVAAVQRVIRGEVAGFIKCSAGISFLAAGALLIIGAQNGLLENYARLLHGLSINKLLAWTASSQPVDVIKSTACPAAKTLGGDLLVSVVSAAVTPIPAPARSSSRAIPPSRRAVVLTLQMKNLSGARKMKYYPWSTGSVDPAQDSAILSDDQGNRYQCLGHAHRDIAAEVASLSPGQSATDTLIFRPLVAPAEQFSLYLPTRNFGKDGALTIYIPEGMIAFDPTDFPRRDGVAPQPPVMADASQPLAAPEPGTPHSEVSEVARGPAECPSDYPLPGKADTHDAGHIAAAEPDTPHSGVSKVAEATAGHPSNYPRPGKADTHDAGNIAACEPGAPDSEVSKVAQATAGHPSGYPLPRKADNHRVGNTFDLSAWRYCVSSCRWNDSFSDPAGRTIRPAEGHRFLTVVVTAQNVSSSTSLLPQVQLAGDDGLCYDPYYKSGGQADGLAVGSQESVSREFTFQAPAARMYSLLLFDGWLATKTAAVRIDPVIP